MSISENLYEVKNKVANALMRSGRNLDACKLLVVSKTWPVDRLAEVVEAGHLELGENRVQEAERKKPQLSEKVHWHLIGPLQRNKARKALAVFDTIHSIDSLRLARYVSNIAQELGKTPTVFLQVKLGDEETKSGFSQKTIEDEMPALLELKGFQIRGLMCIPPPSETPGHARKWFVQLREMRDLLEKKFSCALPELSMGMSGDYEIAIEEGATIVRVGSAIFGARNYG